MDLQLANKVAIVTGASRGIGHAIAQTLSSEDMLLVLAARTRKGLVESAKLCDMECLVQEIARAVAFLASPPGRLHSWLDPGC